MIDVVQTGPDVFVTLDGLPFEGALLNEVGKEEKEGTATLSACDNDGDPQARKESLHVDAKVAPGSGKTTLKVTSVRGSGGGFLCTGTYKRTTDELPAPGSCPVFYTCVCSGTGGGSGACGNGGIGGDPGNVHTDISQADLDSGYVKATTPAGSALRSRRAPTAARDVSSARARSSPRRGGAFGGRA